MDKQHGRALPLIHKQSIYYTMKKITLLSLLCLGSFAAHAQYNCDHAVAVTTGITNVSFAQNSQVPMPVCAPGSQNTPDRGAWYKYTPTALHTTIVSTDIPGYPAHDTRVHIYKGTCGNLVCVGGDDDSGTGDTSITSFTANPGTVYFIAFDNNWNGDDFSFKVTEQDFVPEMFTTQIITTDGYTNCVTDMNGDYLDDIVMPFGGGVKVLYQSANDSGFTPATLSAPATMFMPDWSMAAGDYDKNGYNDLLYGNGSGAAILLANNTGTGFNAKLESPEYIFSQRTNFVDVNADGNLDAFVCHDVEPNVCFVNDGHSGFTYRQGGLGDYPEGGNYGSIWVDYNNDGNIDLFIAKCRGGEDNAAIDDLYRNNGDGTFTNVSREAGLADLHQSWSAAWADFDNDGDMDVMIGNSAGAFGHADPNNPLNAHKLMRNNGNGTFTNVTVGSGYDTFTTPNLEHVAHDFNNDGYVDILGGANTIMFNNGNMTFTPRIILASNGPIGDLNNDGFLDIQNGNRLFLGNPNDNNWIKIHLKGVESNGNGIGARVEVYTTTPGLTKQIRDVKSGDGFKYMSSLNVHFGLGAAEEIEKVVVKWPSGTVDTFLNPDINMPLMVVEGEHVLANTSFSSSVFSVYPNPAKDVLTIANNQNITITKAAIYDMSGKLVKSASVNNGQVQVQSLAKGTYIIIMHDATGKQHTSKFIKG
jgi:hypothetical protein